MQCFRSQAKKISGNTFYFHSSFILFISWLLLFFHKQESMFGKEERFAKIAGNLKAFYSGGFLLQVRSAFCCSMIFSAPSYASRDVHRCRESQSYYLRLIFQPFALYQGHSTPREK